MNDIVITYDNNINSSERLKLILRVIERRCTGFNEIYIVGNIPDWIQGVVHINFTDTESRKFHQKNLYKKLKAVCLRKELTKNFYWIDADFVMPTIDATKAMRIAIDKRSNFVFKPQGTDKIMFQHTQNILTRRGFSLEENFMNNFPISLNKEKLMNTFDDVDFETYYGYCIKNMYCKFNGLKSTGGYITPNDLSKFNTVSSYEKIN